MFMVLCSDMHQFLGNTADIDASASQAPGRALRTRTHIVENSNSQPESFRFLSAAEAARPPTNHNQIVLFLGVKGQRSGLAPLAETYSSKSKHSSPGCSAPANKIATTSQGGRERLCLLEYHHL